MQTLFRGGCSHETVCLACRRPSASSARVTDFYELDLGIKGFKTLAESLVREGPEPFWPWHACRRQGADVCQVYGSSAFGECYEVRIDVMVVRTVTTTTRAPRSVSVCNRLLKCVGHDPYHK